MPPDAPTALGLQPGAAARSRSGTSGTAPAPLPALLRRERRLPGRRPLPGRLPGTADAVAPRLVGRGARAPRRPDAPHFSPENPPPPRMGSGGPGARPGVRLVVDAAADARAAPGPHRRPAGDGRQPAAAAPTARIARPTAGRPRPASPTASRPGGGKGWVAAVPPQPRPAAPFRRLAGGAR